MLACLLACFLASSLPGQARAQEGTSKAGVRLPQSFDGYDDEMGPRVPSRQDEWWQVYAAKDAVPVYTDRTGTKRSSHASLSFLESFWVLNEDKAAKMLELCRSTTEQDQFSPTLAVEEVIGWVSTNDLILSSQPYRTEHLVSRKVFVINDWKEFKVANREEFEKLKVVARAAPDTAAREINKVTGLDSRFSFVYRWDRPGKEGRWALLGTRAFIPVSRPQDCIVGWVPINRLAQWNTRIALEPDPRRTAHADVYSIQAGAQKAYDGDTGTPLFQDKMIRTPAPAASWRYPLLGDVRPGDATALIGWQGGLSIGGDTTRVANPEKQGTIERAAQAIRSRVSHVNIIFVIDATRSMGPYLQAVSRLSREAMRHSSKIQHTDLKVRFGAVVYRDMQDTPPVDQKALTPSSQEVFNFLDRQKEPSGGDKDYPEALFAGLEAALSMAPANETNVLIVIGDAGNNDEKAPMPARVSQLIKEKDPIVQAIWLRRPPKGEEERTAIDDFPVDLRTQIFPLIGAQSDELIERIAKSGAKLSFPTRTSLRETKANIEDMAGAGAAASRLIESVLKYDTEVLVNLPIILSGGNWADGSDPGSSDPDQSAGDYGDDSPYSVTREVLREIAKECANPEEFELLISEKVQLFKPGWVMVNDRKGGPVTRPVQLVSKRDLNDCRNKLLQLFDPSGCTRDALQDAWEEFMKKVGGEGSQSPMEWAQLQYGIPFRDLSPFLSVTYESFEKMPDDEVTQLCLAGRKAIKKLEELDSNEKIWFDLLDEQYAWVPMADMP